MGKSEDALGYPMEVGIQTVVILGFGILTLARHFSSLGALVTVLALAVDPFVQQVAIYKLESVPLPQNPTLPVLLTSIGTEAGMGFIKGPVYSALFGLGNFTQTPDCPNGNCTWAPYQSLAVCSQCVDITDTITYSVSNNPVPNCDVANHYTPCLMTLLNGLSLGTADVTDLKAKDDNLYSLNTSGMLPPITLDQKGYTLANFSLLASPDRDSGPPSAIECSLYWCVNTYTAAVNNTIFTENLRNSYYNATSVLPVADLADSLNVVSRNETFYNITPPTGGAKSDPNVNLTWQEESILEDDRLTQEDYLIAADATIHEWLGPLLSGNASVLVPANDVISNFNGKIANMTTTFNRMAQYLTVAYRNSPGSDLTDPGGAQALGVAWENQTIVRVRWAWLSLPAVLLAATLVFLGATILGNSRGKVGVWKSNTLALLFHGLGSWGGEGMDHVSEMEEKAKRIWVRLVDEGDEEGARLVEKHDSSKEVG